MTRSLHESLSKVQGRENLIFQTYVTFSIDFPKIHITIIFLPMLLIQFFILAKEGYFSHPAPTRISPLLLLFLWILFSTKYNKIM